jgi:hypothetical protein
MDDAEYCRVDKCRLLRKGSGTNISACECRGRLPHSSTGLFGNLELYWPTSPLLNDGRAIANSPASEHVIDLQPNEIAAPELAIDRHIEHRKIASATLHLQPYLNGPDILRLPRALLANQASPVPRCTPAGGDRVIRRHRHLRCRPLPPQHQIDVDRLRQPSPKGRDAAIADLPIPSRMGNIDPNWSVARPCGLGVDAPELKFSVLRGRGLLSPVHRSAVAYKIASRWISIFWPTPFRFS